MTFTACSNHRGRSGLNTSLRCVIFVCTTLSALATSSLSAAQSTPELEAVYEHSGVDTHLVWVAETVRQESQAAWQQCAEQGDRSAVSRILEQTVSADALRQGFMAELAHRIDTKQLDAILVWIRSDAGQHIFNAEKDSINLDEVSFAETLEAYKKSDVHGDARNLLLKNMLADTGAVYFLSALNTEVSALVSIVSICSNTEANVLAAQKQIKEDRGAEALYRSLMRQELIAPSAVVYRHITDAELDAYSQFAKSDAGNAYFSALIKGTRSLLTDKVERISDAIEALPEGG